MRNFLGGVLNLPTSISSCSSSCSARLNFCSGSSTFTCMARSPPCKDVSCEMEGLIVGFNRCDYSSIVKLTAS